MSVGISALRSEDRTPQPVDVSRAAPAATAATRVPEDVRGTPRAAVVRTEGKAGNKMGLLLDFRAVRR
ncbi:hypothetical protein GCM10028793_41920 [Nocardiopsis oceani]